MTDQDLEAIKTSLDNIIVNTVDTISDQTDIHPISVWTTCLARAIGVIHQISPDATIEYLKPVVDHMEGDISTEEMMDLQEKAFWKIVDAWKEMETNGRTIQ